MQTVKTLIRLLLQEQSDLGLHGLHMPFYWQLLCMKFYDIYCMLLEMLLWHVLHTCMSNREVIRSFAISSITHCRIHFLQNIRKCPKISNTKLSDKMPYANSADPDQTAPDGAVWSGSSLFAIPHSILRDKCAKSKRLARKVWNKVFAIERHLPYFISDIFSCSEGIVPHQDRWDLQDTNEQQNPRPTCSSAQSCLGHASSCQSVSYSSFIFSSACVTTEDFLFSYRNSIAGSAICVYSLSAFNKSFTGPFKYQESARSAWERHDNPTPLVQVIITSQYFIFLFQGNWYTSRGGNSFEIVLPLFWKGVCSKRKEVSLIGEQILSF